MENKSVKKETEFSQVTEHPWHQLKDYLYNIGVILHNLYIGTSEGKLKKTPKFTGKPRKTLRREFHLELHL